MLLKKRPALFGRTRKLESQFDEFMDHIIEASLIFERAFKGYLRDGFTENFAEVVTEVGQIESRNDEMKHMIEMQLYEHTLIPDLRGDVLSLIEGLDGILNIYQANCYRISIEKPDIPSRFHKDFKQLAKTTTVCIDSLIMGCRAFFTNIEAVRDHNVKVMFYETEVDKINTRLKTKIFDSDLPLEHKIHLRYIADRVEESSNRAEDVADNLAIYTLKRSF
jgi:predicted phosphate transport protein (TIGR00153 family)